MYRPTIPVVTTLNTTALVKSYNFLLTFYNGKCRTTQVPRKLAADELGAGKLTALRLNDQYLSALKLIQDKFGLSRSDAIRVCIDRFCEELEA